MIELNNVKMRFGDAQLFSDVQLNIAPGSFHFLTGPSGAGKTTLIRLCYGALSPSAGQVQLFGEDVMGLSRDDLAIHRRKIGVVHQEAGFLDHLSIAENVSLPLDVTGQATPARLADLKELLDWVGLGARAQARPRELSGGERQRAALARAVALGPDVILADEPTGNVDAEMSLRLLQLLVELNRMGKAVLIATHDLSLIRAARNLGGEARVLRLAGGTLASAGATL